MNISPRFTEFGMTGAFFLLSQLGVLIYLLGPAATLPDAFDHWSVAVDAYQRALPELLKESAKSLFTVVGVIAIFVTGLMLDLVGSYFAFLEMILFNRHLHRNRDWLDDMAGSCRKTVSDDYCALRDDFGTNFVVGPLGLWKRFGMVHPYKNIQAFLFSYIHVHSSMSETLVDNMHLWRTSRAISTTLLILSAEVVVLRGFSNPVLVVTAALFSLSALITLRSYSRLCFNLFSLACVTQQKGAKP